MQLHLTIIGIFFEQKLEAEWFEGNLALSLAVAKGKRVKMHTPSPMKCLLIASTQCSLKLCNIALVPSITQRIAMVRKNHIKKKTTVMTTPRPPVKPNAFPSVIVHRTTDSC